jgi:hypothetical protein
MDGRSALDREDFLDRVETAAIHNRPAWKLAREIATDRCNL